jgi:hypothetical protein
MSTSIRNPHMRIWIVVAGYANAVNNRIHTPFIYIYSTQRHQHPLINVSFNKLCFFMFNLYILCWICNLCLIA